MIKLNKLLAIAVHAMTIKPRTDTRTNGPIVCLILFHKGRPLGTLTSQMQSIESRKTENAPIAPPTEKPTTTIAVQTEAKGDVALEINCQNNSATAGPPTDDICSNEIFELLEFDHKTEQK